MRAPQKALLALLLREQQARTHLDTGMLLQPARRGSAEQWSEVDLWCQSGRPKVVSRKPPPERPYPNHLVLLIVFFLGQRTPCPRCMYSPSRIRENRHSALRQLLLLRRYLGKLLYSDSVFQVARKKLSRQLLPLQWFQRGLA